MIVNKITKSYQTRSDKPNSNWLNEEWYVVPDNSQLASKIIALYPRFDFVTDENDNLVDVVEVPKTDEETKQERITEIKEELEVLDKTVDRQWEDYYTREKITPVDRIASAIAQKEELRTELQILEV